jgi:hypothetical protein
MSPIEALLRDAYQDAARTVRPDEVRPAVELPPVPGRRHPAFAPLAAAAAVAIAIAAAVAVPHLLSTGHPATTVTTVPNPAAAPPFIVQLPYDGTTTATLVVQAAGTRHVTGTISPPAGTQWQAVAATGSGTKFVAAALNEQRCVTSLYDVTLSGAGRLAGLRPLPSAVIPGRLSTATALAAAADGSTVAYATSPCVVNRAGSRTIGVISRGHGTRTLGLPSETVTSLSLSADGSLLGYVVWPTTAPDHPVAVVTRTRSLGTGRAVSTVGGAIAATLSPDGGTIYVITASGGAAGQPPPYVVSLSAHRTSNGTFSRSLNAWRNVPLLLSPELTAGGDALLVWGITQPDTVAINPVTGRVTPVWMYTPDGEFPESIGW